VEAKTAFEITLEAGYSPLHRGFRFKQIQTHELGAIRDALAENLEAAHLKKKSIITQKTTHGQNNGGHEL
jgi:hypothetical protein